VINPPGFDAEGLSKYAGDNIIIPESGETRVRGS
jgi:hypothetical protein